MFHVFMLFYSVKVFHLNMLHEVPGVVKVLAAGGAGDHVGHAAVVQPVLGVSLALAGEPQFAVVALVCDQGCDRVKTHPEENVMFTIFSEYSSHTPAIATNQDVGSTVRL